MKTKILLLLSLVFGLNASAQPALNAALTILNNLLSGTNPIPFLIVSNNINTISLGKTNIFEVRGTNSGAIDPAIGVNTNGNIYIGAILTVKGRPVFNGGGAVVAGGVTVLAAGKATVSTAFASTTNPINLTLNTSTNALGTVVGISNIIEGTSFQIVSSAAAETNRVGWTIFKP